MLTWRRFIASAGTYANLVRQAKSKQKIIDKMEAAGLIEKIEHGKPLRFNFEDIRKLPPPIIAFDNVAFSYSGKKEDYLYEKLSFGIEYVLSLSPSLSFLSFVVKDLFPHLRNLSHLPLLFFSLFISLRYIPRRPSASPPPHFVKRHQNFLPSPLAS